MMGLVLLEAFELAFEHVSDKNLTQPILPC